jgi:sulfite reductase (NADPH) hemoprotein beta-component
MCNPNPVGNVEIYNSIQHLANNLSAHLTPATGAYHEIWLDKKLIAGGEDHEPLYGKTYLPRKFKIAIAVPPSNDVDVLAHDLGYIAIVENGVLKGYNVTVGGGMGQTHGNKKTYPLLAHPLGFCTPEEAVLVGEKVMLVQRDYGERVNRKHARLKYTIEDRGIDWFRNEVESRLGYKLQLSKAFKFTSNGDRYGWSQLSDGTWSYTLFIQNGRIKDTPEYRLKTGLREIASIHQGDFALTPNQHLIISKIAATEKPRISEMLAKYGIDNAGLSGMRLNSMACVALPTCALAMAESERYLPSLIGKFEHILEDAGLRDDAITIRMTGCPNGCARPSIAEIAFIGKGIF